MHSWDSVSISDGTTTDKFCGTTIPTSFTSNTGFGNVTFISDSSGNFAGFEFDYFCNSSMTTKLPSTKTTTTMTTTTTTNTTSGGNFLSRIDFSLRVDIFDSDC